MIANLAAYNAWKRATLDRVSAKYRAFFLRVFREHLKRIEPDIVRALENGQTDINVNAAGIGESLERVLREHFRFTVKVGVSDGIREITPDKKLSTWTEWPWSMPVEETFVSLAERKQRDQFFNDVLKKIRKQYGSVFTEIINLEKERYLKNLKTIFKTIADDYYKNDDSGYTKDIAKDVISRVFDKTKTQAEMIFRTQTTDYFNEARYAYFSQGTDVDFLQIFAVTDGRISDICENRHLYVIPISYGQQKRFKPPFHPNCRTIISPLISYLKSDAEEIRHNLGTEFGTVQVEKKQKGEVVYVDFVGRRTPPSVPLPKNWA